LTQFLQNTVNGLAITLVYVFLGVAITLISGVARLVDFSQGQVLLLGAYLGFAVASGGVPLWLTIPLATLLVGCWAFVVHTALLRRLTASDALPMFIVTIGIGIALESAIVIIWGSDLRQIPSSLTGVVELGNVLITEGALLVICACLPVLVALYWVIHRTRVGRSMRAAAENRDASTLVGIHVAGVSRATYVLGSCLSGFAGVLLGTAFPFTPFTGGLLVLKGFAVALAGGLGSVSGAVCFGVLLGFVETYAAAYGLHLGFYTFGSEWQGGYAFILMIIVLVWRPNGLFRGTGERVH
jgi:branched-chain amino acid transport system permease protein